MTTLLHAAGTLAAAADGLAGTGQTSTGEAVLFWVLAPVMVIAALGLIFARKTVYAAMSVILVMIGLAVLYVAQEAPFLGIVQVIVYTGAVMMLFLFVLMLVGVDVADTFVETLGAHRWIAAVFGIGLGAVLISVVLAASDIAPVGLEAANAGGNPSAVARIVFGDYAVTLQVVGILLITAAVGAIVLTHKERLVRKISQRERAEARISAGEVLTPLPAPGVYARSNAMDVPALGPDGRPLEHSVSRVLRIRGQQRSVAEVHAHLDAAEGTGSTPPERSITGEEQVR
jgi:NADH-quinone oxidoreductase subunit J